MNAPVRETEVAVSERGVVISERLAGVLRMVCFGPTPQQPALRADVAALAQETIHNELRRSVPSAEAQLDMRRMAHLVDDALRERFGDGDPQARGTLVSVAVQDRLIHVAHSGHGAAILVRGGVICDLVSQCDLSTKEAHPWVGSRRVDEEDNPLLLHAANVPVPLEPGDRVVAVTSPPIGVVDVQGIRELLLDANATSLALNLASIVELKSGIRDLAVGVIDHEVLVMSPEEALQSSVDDDLFAGLSALIDGVTEDLAIDRPTPQAAPRRVTRPPAVTEPPPPPVQVPEISLDERVAAALLPREEPATPVPAEAGSPADEPEPALDASVLAIEPPPDAPDPPEASPSAAPRASSTSALPMVGVAVLLAAAAALLLLLLAT